MAREHWHLTRLGDLVSIKHGWPFKSQHMAEYLPGRPIVVGIGNFEYSGGFRFESTTIKAYIGDYPKEFILKPGDVLLVMTCQTAGGEILGIPGRIPNDGRTYLHNQRMGKVMIKDGKKVEMGFLYWLFLTSGLHRHLVATATGTKILHTAPERIESFSFLLPPLPIQHTIASILLAYDDLIENNTRRIAILEKMAQMLYQEWFVNFRFPGHEQVKMVESELGMIPEGWEVVRLGDIALELRRSVSPESVDPETPYLGLEHLPRKSIALTDWGKAQTVQSTKLVFKKGEILFGKIRPYLHKVGVAPLDGVCSSDTIVISSKQDKYKALLLSCVSSDHFVAFASKTSQGTQMPRANWNVLATFNIAVPPPKLLSLFNDFVASAVDSIINSVFRNRTLRRTRDLLLPKLISGKIDVSPWVEGDVEEAARELAASVAGMTNRYDPIDSAVRRVAEAGLVAPVEEDALEWESLWE